MSGRTIPTCLRANGIWQGPAMAKPQPQAYYRVEDAILYGDIHN